MSRARLRIAPSEFGVPDAQTALLVPMVYRGEAVGVLAAFDRGADAALQRGRRADAAHVRGERRDRRGAGAKRAGRPAAQLAGGRGRRAAPLGRELHDETLQGLGGPAAAALLRRCAKRTSTRAREAMREAMEQIEQEIENLRAIITELRPAALDELGLALRDRDAARPPPRTERCRGRGRARAARRSAGEASLDEELEMTVYRLVQEALTNVAKHAQASSARVAIAPSRRGAGVEVEDDGSGFDADAKIRDSGWPACASASRSRAGRSRSAPRGGTAGNGHAAGMPGWRGQRGELGPRAGRVLGRRPAPIGSPRASIPRAVARPRPTARVPRPVERRRAG